MECLFRKFDTGRRFGVELEVGNEIKKPTIRRHILSVSNKAVYTSRYNLSTNNPYWHVKDDSTCGVLGKAGPKGIEVASFIASGINDLNHIGDVADHLSEKGVKVNKNCGLHIHADASDLCEQQVGRILGAWVKLEPFLALAMPKRRINNPYCEMLWNKSSVAGVSLLDLKLEPLTIYDSLKPADTSYFENNDRRVTLNLVNYCRAIKQQTNTRKTIELRWPEGTLDSNEIKNWVRLFLNFIEYAKDAALPESSSCPTVSQAMNLLGLGHTNKFTILSEGLLKTKIWLLERIVNNPDLVEYSMLMMGSPVLFIPTKKECLEYLDFISNPVKKYS
jgi:hypothetical protein